jgi:hypothetical protein
MSGTTGPTATWVPVSPPPVWAAGAEGTYQIVGTFRITGLGGFQISMVKALYLSWMKLPPPP